MPKYGLIACFSPVITVEWVNISSTGTGSAKIGSWKMEKNWVWRSKKVAYCNSICIFDRLQAVSLKGVKENSAHVR